MLATKCRPQFNETIKSLQFRKLCRFKGKSAEEWMGRLHVAVVECNYTEIDQQLKEQFLHGLNDKIMLDEVIRELTTKSNNEQTSSEDVLAWTKRVEVQWAQSAILNDITESHKFDKIKMAQKLISSQDRETMQKHLTDGHADIVGEVMCPDSAQHMEKCAPDVGDWPLQKGV